jgi:glycosyltransferase involved in cell wall biosynthesis
MSSPGCGKVLHFISWGGRSGAERLVLNLCKATRSLKPAVWFPRDGPIIDEFRRAGIDCLSTRDVVGRPGATREQFSLLHIHCGAYEPAAHRAARSLGIPSLATLHTHISLPELDCPLVCVAPHTAAIQDPLNRVRVIPNAVDTAEFAPGPPAVREKIVIMRVCRPGRCAPWFWDAMRRVLDRHANTELWIVGEKGRSDQELGGCGSAVRFFGMRADVADLLRQADIFAYAPFPDSGSHDLCVLEAMASGVPPVVTDVDSVRQSVRHLQDGILVPFGDVEGFAAALDRLIEDHALRLSLAQNARASAEQRFGLDRMASDYSLAYHDALHAPPPEPADVIRRNVRAFVANRMRIASFEKNLVLLHDTLAATPMAERYWVIGGLLIGWAREGRVLPHDCQDGDFGLLQEDREAFLKAIPILTAAGFEPLARYLDNRGIPVEYAFTKDGARFDFFLHEPAGDHIRCIFFGASPGPKDPRPIEMISQVPRYGLAPMDFLGRRWRKPDDHEAFLAAEYGEWRARKPAFDHRSDDRSVIVVNWWTNSSSCEFET